MTTPAIKITAKQQARINSLADKIGKTPNAITKAAIELYLEEMEDYLEVQAIKKKGGKNISLKELGKRLGLEG